MRVKFVNEHHPWRDDHNQNESKEGKKYHGSSNLKVLLSFRVFCVQNAFPYVKMFKDHWAQKKAKQQTLHGGTTMLFPKRQKIVNYWNLNNVNQLPSNKMQTWTMGLISLLFIVYWKETKSDELKAPSTCFQPISY